MRCLVLVVTATLSSLVLAAPAQADTSTTYRQSGELLVSWQGAAAGGCAAAGVCDVRGGLTAQSTPGVTTQSSSGTLSFNSALNGASSADDVGDVNVSFDAAAVRVRRSSGTCAEPLDLSGSTFSIDPTGRGRFSLEVGSGGLWAGRCAGPGAEDFGAFTLPGHLVGRPARGAKLDLRGVGSALVGPYAMTVRSTLALHLRTDHSKSSVTRGRAPAPPPRGRPVRTRRELHLSLIYRMDPATGAVTLDYTGDAAPGCEVLDACGARGTARYPLSAAGGSLELRATGPAPRRASLRAALKALRRGRLHVSAFTEADLSPAAGALVSRTEQPGEPPCVDSLAVPGPVLDLQAGRRTLVLALGREGSVKGRCPGPLSADAWPTGTLARAVLPLTGARTVQATLSSSGAFAGPGWTGTRMLALPVTLHRTAAKTRIVRVAG